MVTLKYRGPCTGVCGPLLFLTGGKSERTDGLCGDIVEDEEAVSTSDVRGGGVDVCRRFGGGLRARAMDLSD
jgi:hypothetical protein